MFFGKFTAQHLYKIGFRTRILVAFLLLSIPLLVGVSVVFYLYLADSAKKNAIQEIQKTINITSVNIELLIRDTENLSRLILYDDDVQVLLGLPPGTSPAGESTSVSSLINTSLSYRDFIDSVVIMAGETTVYSTESALSDVVSTEKLSKKWWFHQLDPRSFAFRWVAAARSESLDARPPDNDLMLIRRIVSKQDFTTTLGTMMIYLKKRYFDELLQGVPIGKTGSLAVYDEDKTRLFIKNNQSNSSGIIQKNKGKIDLGIKDNDAFLINEQGSTYLLNWSKFSKKDWLVISVAPFSELSTELSLLGQQMLLMVIITVLIAILVSFVISTSISNPIKLLSRMMDAFGENPDSHQETDLGKRYRQRQDEVGLMYHSFNRLTSRIQSLIKENYLKDIEKQKAELAALESQINPHFLYNTLDSINWLAMANGQARISDMVTALSDTFRMSLHRTNSFFIAFRDELLHAESYLTIQKYRYGDKLVVRYNISPGMPRLYVLRFILQPLIENALEHGIDRLDGRGAIDIKAEEMDDRICIQIRNDGEAPDLDRINRIVAGGEDGAKTDQDPACYGIANIHARIRLIHGEGFGLSYSLQGGQTICTIVLPLLHTTPPEPD